MSIRLFKPSIGKEEIKNIKETISRSWLGLGPNVNLFETKWKNHLKCKEAVAVNSGTAALHLGLKLFNFKKGKKVLVPSMSFSATASSVLYNDLEPVFVDSNPLTLNLDFNDLKKKYTKDCVAIIVVHYSGHPAEIDKIVNFANEKKIKVIEDCAHTDGSKFKNKPLGLWGNVGCFSFEEKKILTTGDGGMICSNEKGLLKNVKAMRWVGIDKDNWKSSKQYTKKNKKALHWYYEINQLGYKYNMNDLAASIGLAQIKKLKKMNQKRKKIINFYISKLKLISEISFLVPYDTRKYTYQIFGIRTNYRNKLIIYLKNKGIPTGCHWTPMTLQPLFKKYKNKCKYIEKEIDRCLTLPLHADLTLKEVSFVCKNIIKFFDEKINLK